MAFGKESQLSGISINNSKGDNSSGDKDNNNGDMDNNDNKGMHRNHHL